MTTNTTEQKTPPVPADHPRGAIHELLRRGDREAAELFQRLVRERRHDPAGLRRMRILFQEQSFETVAKPAEELFDIRTATPEFPEYAPIVNSEICAGCGEQFMGTKRAAGRDAPTCLTCAQADCLAVLGRGICVLRGGGYPPRDLMDSRRLDA